MEVVVGVFDGGDQGGVGFCEDVMFMDVYLWKLGLYWKLVVKDGLCLFWVVVEQVLYFQFCYVEVRMVCIYYF